MRSLLRIATGLITLCIGIIGLLMPIIPGWLFLGLALIILSPEHGKKIVGRIKDMLKNALYRRHPHRKP